MSSTLSGLDLRDVTRDDAALRRFLSGLPGVDQVGAEARTAGLATRSIKTTAKAWAIDTAISMVDLTTLEGFAITLPPHYALVVGKVTQRFPVVVHVAALPAGTPASGVTQSFWDRVA